MAEPHKPINQQQLVTEWLKITIDRFQKAIKKSGISQERQNLFNSLESSMQKGSDGAVQLALLKFKMHGRFVDMGVGRGVPVGSQRAKADFLKYRNEKGQLHKYGRSAKKWYSRTLSGQTKKLSELLLSHFGTEAIQVMENKIQGNTEIKF